MQGFCVCPPPPSTYTHFVRPHRSVLVHPCVSPNVSSMLKSKSFATESQDLVGVSTFKSSFAPRAYLINICMQIDGFRLCKS